MKCEQKKHPWPFRPDHLTNDGAPFGLTGTGIITNRHLQGIQSEICHVLGQPTTIIEFSPEGRPIRTDSPLLAYAIHDACKYFRERNFQLLPNATPTVKNVTQKIDGVLCRHCDECHAALYRGLTTTELTPANLERRFQQDPSIQELYRYDESAPPRYSYVTLPNRPQRLFAQYDCPLLGFRELLFPILLEDTVIAALFVGQITIVTREAHIESAIATIADRFPNCFSSFLSNHNSPKDKTLLSHEILSQYRNWLAKDPEERDLSEDKYQRLIERCAAELFQFENLLAEELTHQRIAYIRSHVSRELKQFSVPISVTAKSAKSPAQLHRLWSKVDESLDRLVDAFSLRYALVFGINQATPVGNQALAVVAKAGRWSSVLSKDDLAAIRVNHLAFPDEYVVCSRDANSPYLRCLGGIDVRRFGDFQLVLLPVAAHRHCSIAVLLGYHERNPSKAKENDPAADLNTSLQTFYILIVSALAATVATAAEDNAKKQLLYLGHEIGQLVAGLDWLRMTYLDAPTKVRDLPHKKLVDLCQDLKGFIGQMAFIFDIASNMGADTLPASEPINFFPFGEVLWKWKDTYRLEIERKCLQFCLPLTQKGDPRRPELYADKFLFEQLVYNLVNNAEKYCHRGTKIHVDCRLRFGRAEHFHALTVTNFGQRMPPGNEVYQPFTRGDTDEKGLGIGLYVAWLIVVHAHKGKIFHECSDLPLSPYNVPLIVPYTERDFPGKDMRLAEALRQELVRLRGELHEIVAYSEKNEQKYSPTHGALAEEILKPTYRVTVTAMFPVEK